MSCGNTATCQKCSEWANFLHVERAWRGKPAQMIQVSGFGGDGSSIAETVGLGKVYREHLEWRFTWAKTSRFGILRLAVQWLPYESGEFE